MVQLIATPEKFQGKFVRVEGYVSLEFEDYALYLTRDDYEHLTGDNAVWIDFKRGVLKSPDQLNGKYVLIEGTYDAREHGHLGMFSGEIRNVSRIELMATRSDYKKIR